MPPSALDQPVASGLAIGERRSGGAHMRRLRRSVLVAGACVGTALVLAASACGAGQGGSPPNDEGASSSPSAFEFKPLDAGGPITKEALERGDVQVAWMSSSDADIAVNDW